MSHNSLGCMKSNEPLSGNYTNSNKVLGQGSQSALWRVINIPSLPNTPGYKHLLTYSQVQQTPRVNLGLCYSCCQIWFFSTQNRLCVHFMILGHGCWDQRQMPNTAGVSEPVRVCPLGTSIKTQAQCFLQQMDLREKAQTPDAEALAVQLALHSKGLTNVLSNKLITQCKLISSLCYMHLLIKITSFYAKFNMVFKEKEYDLIPQNLFFFSQKMNRFSGI